MPEVALLFVLLGRSILLGAAVLLSQGVVLLMEAGSLLLEGGNILLTQLNLALEARNLARIASRGLLGVLPGAFVLLKLLLEAEHLEDHDVGPVEDQGQEEGKAAKVHVTLRVELARLHFMTFVGHHRRPTFNG